MSEKPTLTVMCGLSGSGKSTKAHEIAERTGAIVVSSDELRKELFGDERFQGEKDKLFREYHKRVHDNLAAGRDVVADKTNISIRSRRALLEAVKDLDVYKDCVICNVKYSDCLENNRNRSYQLPDEVIRRQLYGFQVPFCEEGWDEIRFTTLPKQIISAQMMGGFDQKNPYHTEDLYDHSVRTTKAFLTRYPDKKLEGMFHDIGKTRTQKIGEDGIAHYYGHQNVGAYMILTELGDDLPRLLDVSFVANYHMMPISWTTSKVKEKWRKIFGDEKFEMLMYFHECDMLRKETQMKITGMNHFQNVCEEKLIDWYNRQEGYRRIDRSNVYIVWSCRILQNYKCLASTDIPGDGVYAEYTYNGDKQELYEDVYKKIQNNCHTEE